MDGGWRLFCYQCLREEGRLQAGSIYSSLSCSLATRVFACKIWHRLQNGRQWSPFLTCRRWCIHSSREARQGSPQCSACFQKLYLRGRKTPFQYTPRYQYHCSVLLKLRKICHCFLCMFNTVDQSVVQNEPLCIYASCGLKAFSLCVGPGLLDKTPVPNWDDLESSRKLF